MRNLVLLSLDGLSQTRFNSVAANMPALLELMHRSIVFRRFHAASTSSFQSFCDLAFGDSSELDHNTAYPSGGGCLRGRSGNFFATLRERGYETLGVGMGNPCPDHLKGDRWGAWPEACGAFRPFTEKEAALAATTEFVNSARDGGKPFALYLSTRHLLPSDRFVRGGSYEAVPGYAEKGALIESIVAPGQLDSDVVAPLISLLSGAGVLENTLVVVFAGHGLDFWTHGLCGGRTHAVDPYADLTWLPLFIYNNGKDAGIYDNLVSMVDLKPTLLGMLFPDIRPEEPQTPFAGMNVFQQQRALAFSQRMFARQLDNRDVYKSMAKSYAITDGDQRLIVSSDRGKKGQGGMELYYDVRDPSNTRNFLDFFKLDNNGNMREFGHSDVVHVHFLQSFKPHLVMSIADSYNVMRQHLFNLVRAKEMAAILDPQNPQGETLPDHVFTYKRERHAGRLI